MTKFIAVDSGKGGTGKTTTVLNLATALGQFGRDVLAVDCSLNSPHLALFLGAANVDSTIHDVLKGRKRIRDSAYIHASGVRIVPGSISPEKQAGVFAEGIGNHIRQLSGASEVVLLDLGNNSQENSEVLKVADELLIVTNPDIVSVTESLKTIKKSEELGVTVVGVVLNKVKDVEGEMSIESVQALLDKPVIAVIPDDKSITESVHLKHPVVYSHPKSKSSESFKVLAGKLIGDEYSRL
ncbi:P-loop NTPase [Candidatus Woesearchaeota archaeon]|nr:P-loop NTPase [Candidatus Woesearchaeota archaeon]